MQIKFILNIKNKKSKLNNIHYKLNVFQIKILNEILKVNNVYYKLIQRWTWRRDPGGGGWWLYDQKGLGAHVPLRAAMFMTTS